VKRLATRRPRDLLRRILALRAERARLRALLIDGQKMRAVAEVSRGAAHDFNNLLLAVRTSLEAIQERAGADAEVSEEVHIIEGAAERAGRFLRQLLAFSAREDAVASLLTLNDVIAELEPTLRKVAGPTVDLKLDLDPDLEDVAACRAKLEHALVDLVATARDAMTPLEGAITIETRNVGGVLEASSGELDRRSHVGLTLRSSGAPQRPAATLALAAVAAFVESSNGRVLLLADDTGNKWTLYFPVADAGAIEHSTQAMQRSRS